MDINWLTIIIILMVVYISYLMIQNADELQLSCIISDLNGKKYCVRDRKNKEDAADLLAQVAERLKKLVKYLEIQYPNDARTVRLKQNFNPKVIIETLPTSEFKAYSENKGEKLAFCLNKDEKNNNKLIDLNTLMYVALHEVAHVCSVSIGHTPEFWTNFKWLIINAKEINIYEPIDYKKQNKNYCGMTISDNPYYNV